MRSVMLEISAYVVLVLIFAAVMVPLLRHVRRANASAPPEAIRTPQQRYLNHASAAILLAPLAYWFFVAKEPWPFLTMLLSFVAGMLVLRAVKVPWRARLWVAPFIAVACVVPGALVDLPRGISLLDADRTLWLPLAIASPFMALSYVLSVYSFPLAYGERSD
jgi:hypothetical protein